MARIGNKRFEVIIPDRYAFGDEKQEVSFYHRLMTTPERYQVQFMAQRFAKDESEDKGSMIDAQVDMTMATLLGFEDGYFSDEDADGNTVPVSSNPDSPGYREDWKEWLKANASDLVESFAVYMIENSSPARAKRQEDAAKK